MPREVNNAERCGDSESGSIVEMLGATGNIVAA